MQRVLFLVFLFFSIVTAQIQITGYNEDFDDAVLTGWEAPNSATFALTEANGVLRISYNRTTASTEWDNFNYTPPPVDVGQMPFITVKVRSTVACELTFKPIYDNGDDNWLSVQVLGDNAWHDVTFNLGIGESSIITRVYMYLDGGTTAAKSGVVYFEDLCFGDSTRSYVKANTEELDAAVASAEALLVNAVEGSGEGEIATGSKAVLQTAIQAAMVVAGKSMAAQKEVDDALWQLSDACVEFEKKAKIPNPGLIDPDASAKTKYLYMNLEQGCGKRLLFGMHDATGYGVGWSGDDDRSDIKSVCGDYPALYSWDMNTVDRGSADEMRRFIYRIKSAYSRGAVNTLCWHQYDPKGRSFYGDKLPGENIVSTLLPNGKYHAFYKNRLTRIARFLKGLRGKDGYNIPIIFRPYHEHDSGAFWWGTNNCSTEEYNQIWQFTVRFLRDSLNVHNLIYAISPIGFTRRSEYLKIYPGDSYIDILGMDFYYWAPLAERQTSFVNSLAVPVQLAQERAKVAALTEVGYENIPEPSWFNQYLLPPFLNGSPASRMCYAAVWRNASTSHFFAPYPGHATVPGFMNFYNHPYTAFEQDLPPMYARPGSDSEPPLFTVKPDSYFVVTDTLVTLTLITNERSHLRYGPADVPYAQMPERFDIGQGGFQHSTLLRAMQGETRSLYIRAIDISGNEITKALRVVFKVDTLQRAIPWYDLRYPFRFWPSGKAPLGYGAGSGNVTTTATAKTVYFVTTFELAELPTALGLLVKCHDGAVVYLNGQELLRYNLPSSGSLSHGTNALSTVKINNIYMFTPAALRILHTGHNLLAVQVHTAAATGVDLSLDARVFDQNHMYLNLGSSWHYFDGDQPPPLLTLQDYISEVKNADAVLPHEFTLQQNYPNPFNPNTTIAYDLPKSAQVELTVFDITGRTVTTLVNERKAPGQHTSRFNAAGLASGLYFYQLTADDVKIRKRMLLVK